MANILAALNIEQGWGKVRYDLVIALATGIFTGFFVDFLIKRREEERWSHARNLFNLQLLRIFDNLLDQVVPKRRKGTAGKYCSLAKDAFLQLKFEPRDPDIFLLSPNMAWLRLTGKSLAKVTPRQPIRSKPFLLMGPLGKAMADLGTLRLAYGPVQEPRLRGMLVEFSSYASSFEELDKPNLDWKNPDLWQPYHFQLISILMVANGIRKEIISMGELSEHLPELEVAPGSWEA